MYIHLAQTASVVLVSVRVSGGTFFEDLLFHGQFHLSRTHYYSAAFRDSSLAAQLPSYRPVRSQVRSSSLQKKQRLGLEEGAFDDEYGRARKVFTLPLSGATPNVLP